MALKYCKFYKAIKLIFEFQNFIRKKFPGLGSGFMSGFRFFLSKLNDFLIIGDEALAFYNEEDHSDDEPEELSKDFIDEGDNHPQSVIRQKIR